jgi:hypothetical protein
MRVSGVPKTVRGIAPKVGPIARMVRGIAPTVRPIATTLRPSDGAGPGWQGRFRSAAATGLLGASSRDATRDT